MPLPSPDQALPLHFAMFGKAFPPAVVNGPPTYRSVPTARNVKTSPFVPPPTSDHALPFHCARWFAVTLPDPVNVPPA